MQFIAALLKKLPVMPVLLLIAGFLFGLLFGYVIAPVNFVDATPAYLRADLQEDYLRMAIDSFRLNADPNLAVQRWQNLGPGAQEAYNRIQEDPRGADPGVIKIYGEVITSVLSDVIDANASASDALGGSTLTRTAFIAVGGFFLLGVIAAGVMYLSRYLRKRETAEVTTVVQDTEVSRNAEKTNFEDMGLAPPITQTMTTYVLGDDLYDESFSIDTEAGEFMGEYGVGVSESIGVGDPKKVSALEIWLFDKNDIKTATKVLMSQHAYNDSEIRNRLERKGELVVVEPQSQVLLETATLQLLATVVDLEYGKGPMPNNSYFQRITLELAIWPRQS